MDVLDGEYLSRFQLGIGTGARAFVFEAFRRRHVLLERVLIGWRRERSERTQPYFFKRKSPGSGS